MMPLNSAEIEVLVQDLRQLIGARLQEVQSAGRELGLGLYINSQAHWLWFDMDATRPMLLILGEPPKKFKTKLPIGLFLNAHGKGLKLADVTVDESGGRIIHFHFGREPEPLEIEARLFPHGENIIIRKGIKSISFAKIQDLKSHRNEVQDLPVRSLAEIERQWRSKSGDKTIQKQANKKDKALEKKRSGLKKMKEELETKNAFDIYSRLGEWLKVNQTLKVPLEFKDYILEEETLAENIQNAFQKSKTLRHKHSEGLLRLAKLEQEIAKLETAPAEENLNLSVLTGTPTSIVSKKHKDVVAKYRTLKLSPEFEAYMGKSAKDNLAILRKAQAWDLWLHLRDMPGAHVIIRRPKNTEVPDALFDQTIRWLVRETAPKKFSKGDIVEVQFQEVRHVRPIKGEKIGRVAVHDPKHRRLRLTSD